MILNGALKGVLLGPVKQIYLFQLVVHLLQLLVGLLNSLLETVDLFIGLTKLMVFGFNKTPHFEEAGLVTFEHSLFVEETLF